MKKIKTLQLPHGWFKGRVGGGDIINTIDATIMYWHTLIVEIEDNENETREIDRNDQF